MTKEKGKAIRYCCSFSWHRLSFGLALCPAIFLSGAGHRAESQQPPSSLDAARRCLSIRDLCLWTSKSALPRSAEELRYMTLHTPAP
jgi:hypothetical protein